MKLVRVIGIDEKERNHIDQIFVDCREALAFFRLIRSNFPTLDSFVWVLEPEKPASRGICPRFVIRSPEYLEWYIDNEW